MYVACNVQISRSGSFSSAHLKCDDNTAQSSKSLKYDDINTLDDTEWPKKMYTLFTHQYPWNKFK